MLPRIIRVDNGENPEKIGKDMLENYRISSEKRRKKIYIYKNKPELFFNILLIRYLFLAKTYKLDSLEVFTNYYQKAIKYINSVGMFNFLIADEMVENNPSAIANNVYYLDYLGIKLNKNQITRKIKDYWLSKKPKDVLEWRNKIYGLTHLIIAATYFYQRFVSKDQFIWILDLFNNEIEEIISNTNVDVVAEVGLCFKLCKEKKSRALDKAREYVLSKYDPRCGYIVKEESEGSLEKAEHRNIIAVLLLSDFSRFNLGPDMLSYLKERKRLIFLPKVGEFVGHRHFILDT
jgi:hypothetical protein